MTEADRTKLLKTAKANGKLLALKPAKKKPTPPDLPTVATHGTTIDESQVVEALQSVPGFPIPPIGVVTQWDQQARAEALRWAHHTNRNTEPLPEVIESWVEGKGAATPAAKSRFAEPEPQEEQPDAPDTEASEESAEPPAWLTAERQLTPSGISESAIERVNLDPELEHNLTEQMVNQWRDLQMLEGEKKEVMKDFSERIKFLKESIGRTSDSLRNGWEDRSVSCRWYYNFAAGEAELRRNDNGEVMKTRILTMEERQLQLQLDEDRHLDDAEDLSGREE